MILPHIQVGDSMDISGPAGKVIYLGRGYIRVKYPGKPEQIRFATDVGLIAGGTGKRTLVQVVLYNYSKISLGEGMYVISWDMQCSVRREGTGHYFSFQPFSRPLSMLSTHNTYQNDPQGIPINVIIMISHHVTVR